MLAKHFSGERKRGGVKLQMFFGAVALLVSATVLFASAVAAFSLSSPDSSELCDGVKPNHGPVEGGTWVSGCISDIELEPDDKIVQLSGFGLHSLALSSGGKVFTWGNNEYGQLGNPHLESGKDAYQNSPVEIPADNFQLEPGDKILGVATGLSHSLALSSEGRVFTWGHNDSGQLGNLDLESGQDKYQNRPKEIPASAFQLDPGDKIVYVSGGSLHSLAVSSGGKVFTWGHNNSGQLGTGESGDNKNIPQDITGNFSGLVGDKIVYVSGGGFHSLAVSSGGKIFSWGDNAYGQLGNPDLGSGQGEYQNRPKEIPADKFQLEPGDKILGVAAGLSHSLALSTEGKVFTWGNNDYGQLGIGESDGNKNIPQDITENFPPSDNDKIVHGAEGGAHSLAVSSKGRVFTWGNNAYGQLGTRDTNNQNIPQDITKNFPPLNNDKIVHGAEGGAHSLAVSSKGRVFTWGNNADGQLGNGNNEHKDTPQHIEVMGLKIETLDNVLFGGVAALDVSLDLDSGAWKAKTPAHPAGVVDVTVRYVFDDDSIGSYTFVNAFTFTESPPGPTAPPPGPTASPTVPVPSDEALPPLDPEDGSEGSPGGGSGSLASTGVSFVGIFTGVFVVFLILSGGVMVRRRSVL